MTDKINARFEWALRHARGTKILDIGFAKNTTGGEYLHKQLVARNPGSLVVGLDLSERVFNPEMRLGNTVRANALKMPFKDGSFDAFCLFEMIEHTWEPKHTIDEVHRVLKKGGKVFLSSPNPYDVIRVLRTISSGRGTLGEETHTMFLCPISFKNLFEKSGFVVERMETVIFRIPFARIEVQCVLPWPLKYGGYNQCYVARKV